MVEYGIGFSREDGLMVSRQIHKAWGNVSHPKNHFPDVVKADNSYLERYRFLFTSMIRSEIGLKPEEFDQVMLGLYHFPGCKSPVLMGSVLVWNGNEGKFAFIYTFN